MSLTSTFRFIELWVGFQLNNAFVDFAFVLNGNRITRCCRAVVANLFLFTFNFNGSVFPSQLVDAVLIVPILI